jgi:hypothetical protein
MSDNQDKTLLAVLIVLSISLFVFTIGKVAISIMGNYGDSLFVLCDNVSNAIFIPWLIVLLFYVVRIGRNREEKN